MSRDAMEKTPRGSTPAKKTNDQKPSVIPPPPPVASKGPAGTTSVPEPEKTSPSAPAKPSDGVSGATDTKPVAQSVATSSTDSAGKASTSAVSASGTESVAKPVASAADAHKPVEVPTTTPPRSSVKEAAAAGATTPAVEKTKSSSAAKKAALGPRRVRLAVSRIDPWSIMKLSFLLSIAIGIMIVVATTVFWLVLDGLHVFTQINDLIVDIIGEDSKVDLLQYVEFKRVVSLATIIAVVDVVLLTALSTIGAFLYNVVAALVGGVHLTLIDE